METVEPILECEDLVTEIRQVVKLTSLDWTDNQALASTLVRARAAVEQCYDACADVLESGRAVVERTTNQHLGWADIEHRRQNAYRLLDRYERLGQNLPFSHWASGSLRDHDNDPTASQVFDEQLNFIHDRHAVRDHVGIEYKDLEHTRWHKQLRVNSTFHNYEIAERTIGRVLAYYWDKVVAWLNLTELDEPNWWKRNGLVLPSFETSTDIGYAIKQRRAKRHITTKLRVVLVRDQRAPKGFWIKDAYPVL